MIALIIVAAVLSWFIAGGLAARLMGIKDSEYTDAVLFTILFGWFSLLVSFAVRLYQAETLSPFAARQNAKANREIHKARQEKEHAQSLADYELHTQAILAGIDSMELADTFDRVFELGRKHSDATRYSWDHRDTPAAREYRKIRDGVVKAKELS